MIDVTDAALREGLYASLGVRRWVEDVAARAPYATLDELLAVAADAATPLSEDEIAEALEHHPRIGERPKGQGTAQSFSSAEQQAPDADDEVLAAEIAKGNVAYEARFERIFIIRAAGRTRREVLAELHRRLVLDDETELQTVGEQLRDIALLRIRKLYGGEA